MLAKFYGAESERTIYIYIYLNLEKEKENFCVVFAYFMKGQREISCRSRATTAKKCKKIAMHVQSCCFANINQLLAALVAVVVIVVVA